MRKVVITGASKGIGLAIAKEFVQHGDIVCISSRKQENLETAKQEILADKHQARVQSFVCDMANQSDIEKFAQFITDDFGGCDVLVNNAGIFLPGSVHQEEEGNYELMMKVNVEGSYRLTRALVPTMKEHQAGDIVNICSIASETAYDNGGSYSISKFAMLGFSKNLREELKPHGVRVIAVLPGAVLTDSWVGYDGDPNRLMPPEDIASLVLNACNLSRRSVVEEIIVRPQLGDL